MSRVRRLVDQMFEENAPEPLPPSEDEKRRNAWRYRDKRSTGATQTPPARRDLGTVRAPISTRDEIKRTFF